MIAMLWTQKIIVSKKTYNEVPRLLKEQVRELLIKEGYENLTTE